MWLTAVSANFTFCGKKPLIFPVLTFLLLFKWGEKFQIISFVFASSPLISLPSPPQRFNKIFCDLYKCFPSIFCELFEKEASLSFTKTDTNYFLLKLGKKADNAFQQIFLQEIFWIQNFPKIWFFNTTFFVGSRNWYKKSLKSEIIFLPLKIYRIEVLYR